MDIILFIIVLSVIIVFHEFGHFYFARKANILCHEFALGMGPVLYQKRKGEIVYSLRAIPLGGYVAMAGEEIEEALVKKGQIVGIKKDELNRVSAFVLTEDKKCDEIGKIIDFDLYGKSNKELFLKIEVNEEIKTYEVLRTAKYLFAKNKEQQIAPAERSFENKTLWQRFLVIFAGPATNFILAFLILLVLAFFIGKPSNSTVIAKPDEKIIGAKLNENEKIEKINGVSVDKWSDIIEIINKSNNPIISIGLENREVTIVAEVSLQGLGIKNDYTNIEKLIIGNVFGRKKDILENDEILALELTDNREEKSYYIPSNWKDLIIYVKNNSEKDIINLKLLRDDKEVEITYDNIKESVVKKLDQDYVVYKTGLESVSEFNLGYTLLYPFRKMGHDISGMIQTLGLLFAPNSGVSIKDLSGPIGIFKLVSDAKKNGPLSFFAFVAFLSVNIGFINLMPIPALDGGRLVFLGYEAIFKKKVNKKVENTIISITFFLLIGLIIFVSYQDIFRIIK